DGEAEGERDSELPRLVAGDDELVAGVAHAERRIRHLAPAGEDRVLARGLFARRERAQVGPLPERRVEIPGRSPDPRVQTVEARVREIAGRGHDRGAVCARGLEVAAVRRDVGFERERVEVEAVVVVPREVAPLEPDALELERLPARAEALL